MFFQLILPVGLHLAFSPIVCSGGVVAPGLTFWLATVVPHCRYFLWRHRIQTQILTIIPAPGSSVSALLVSFIDFTKFVRASQRHVRGRTEDFLRMTVSWPSQDDLLKWLSSDLSNWGRWGSDDQKGTLNHLSPEKTLQAVSLVSEGVIVSCARPVDFKASVDVPRPPQHFMVSAGDTYRKGESAVRGDRQVAIDYFGLIFHGHTVTHIDSLAHFFWDGQTYNGRPSSVVSTAEGATEFDVMAAAGGIVTKGVLVDAPLLRGVDFIERGDGIGVADIEAAEREHGVRVEKGDVLLLRTGQLGRREVTGPVDVRVDGSSGPSPEILPLLYERDVAVMGSDTGNDIGPNPYDRFTNPVHQVGIVGLGLWILDNAWLDDLAEACVRRGKWEFMFSVLPLKLPAVTGSPVNPVAIF